MEGFLGEYGVPDSDPRWLAVLDDFLETLETQLRDLERVLKPLRGKQGDFRYEPDKWSVKELLGHINDAERIFFFGETPARQRADDIGVDTGEKDMIVEGIGRGLFPGLERLLDFGH